jgi:hypothetical protein
MSIAQSFGSGAAYNRERTDSITSINSSTERVMASPLTGLPSGESIRGLASAASGSNIRLSPTVKRAQLGVPVIARRESQIEREEHRTTGDQEGAHLPGEVLEPIEPTRLGDVDEDYEMHDEEAEAGTPLVMMGLRERQGDVMGSFSGVLPVLPLQRPQKRKWKLEKKLGEGAFSAVWAATAVLDEGEIGDLQSKRLVAED